MVFKGRCVPNLFAEVANKNVGGHGEVHTGHSHYNLFIKFLIYINYLNWKAFGLYFYCWSFSIARKQMGSETFLKLNCL